MEAAIGFPPNMK